MSNQAKHGEFCWHELMTSDVNKAKTFYNSLLGWTTQEHDMGEMTYVMFKHGETDIGGMMQIPADKAGECPPHWMNYISVENVDTIEKKAKELGAKIVVPVTPVSDFGRFIIIADPTGAHIAFWQSLKSC